MPSCGRRARSTPTASRVRNCNFNGATAETDATFETGVMMVESAAVDESTAVEQPGEVVAGEELEAHARSC